MSKVYQGIVEDNNDPSKTGRVRVRIPELHGTKGSSKYIPTELLPWVESSTLSGYQYGTLMVPPKGVAVSCTIDNQTSVSPRRTYSGTSYGTGSKSKVQKTIDDEKVPKGKLETPTEATKDYPGTAVLYKSTKGSSIRVDSTGAIILNTGGTNITMSGGTTAISSGKTSMRIRKGSIEAKDGTANITVNGGNITLKNSGASIRIKGNTVECKAGDALVLLGEDSVEVKYDDASAKFESSKITLDNSTSKVEMDAAKVTVDNATSKVELDGAKVDINNGSSMMQINGSQLSMTNGTSTINASGSTLNMTNGACSVDIAGSNVVVTGTAEIQLNAPLVTVNGTPIP